ncbi:MAG: hypothetical protein HQ559_17230 [Lentisphaerae bacterium]|nr:hypothetical protein [Lentisphaerota bacterium]
MKSARILIVIVLVVFVGLLAWRFLPRFRKEAEDAYQKYGGWTEEARQHDPVRFIDHAEQELTAHLGSLKQARQNMAGALEKIATEIDKTRSLLSSSETLAGEFRSAYRGSEQDGSYPVEVSGSTYGKEQLVEQVRLILMQRKNYKLVITELESAAETAKTRAQDLLTHITNTEASLASLPAKREIARLNELTGDMSELLEQVNELIGSNKQLLDESPIRTVEQLVAAGETAAPERVDTDVMAFLEGEE